MIFKKSQFSVIELIFLVLLFITISNFIFFDFKIPDKDYHLFLESSLDSIYYSQDYRNLVIDEDLTMEGLTQDWSSLNNTLTKITPNFEVIIIGDRNEKTIFECTEVSGKIYDERLISINSGTDFKFRKLRLGVCY